MNHNLKTTNILNVNVNCESKEIVLQQIKNLLEDKQQHYIVTPNPEMVVYSTKDEEYRNILNKADIKTPDGFGLKLASLFNKEKISEIITGVGLTEDLCHIAEQKKYSIYLLGSRGGVVEKAVAKLQIKFPTLKIAGFDDGGEVDIDGFFKDETVLNRINQCRPVILFVAFGFPKQEKLINNYLTKLPTVKLAIGIGGTFDFISGEIKRAPKILQIIGLEWLWRLILQPSRFKRIYNAVVRFPLLFLKWKIFNLS